MMRSLHYFAGRLSLLVASGALCLEAAGAVNPAAPPRAETDLFRTGTIPRLRIQMDAAAADSLRSDPREFVSVTVSEGAEVFPQVALHLKGSTGSFRPLDDKPAMTLDFSRFQAGRKFHGLRRIYLNNSVEDPSYTNEKIGSEFFEAAGLPAPRVTRALVGLNAGAPRLYVLKEGFTEDFLARHFHQISGELYEPGAGHDVNETLDRNAVDAPFDKQRTALKELAAAAQEADPAQRWRKLEKALDMRQFLAFMAAEVMLGHRDGYSLNRNNYRVYHDLDSGKMVFIPQGMDQLFGTAELPWQPNWSGLVAEAVMSTPEGSAGYAEALNKFMTNQFIGGKLEHRIDELVRELRPPILGKNEFAQIEAAAAVVKERIANRRMSLITQLKRPVLRPLEFAAGSAHPEGWEMADRPAQGSMDEVDLAGRKTLHIAVRTESLSSWRTIVWLPQGKYCFTDRVRVAGVAPLASGGQSGARLRVGGTLGTNPALSDDGSWQNLAANFEVGPPMSKVELICEFRARGGEAWFDLDAMRVLQKDKNHEN